MSDTCPPTWPYGWWIITFEFGRANRLPFVPAARRMAAPLAARPMQYVLIEHSTNCMQSYRARVADTLPPGELMYMWMSADLFSVTRNRIFWIVRFAR